MAASKGSRTYPQKEAKKPKRIATSTPFEKEKEPACKFSDKDICLRCLDRANYVNMVSVGEHHECPDCNWHCKCFK